jgi:prefoldin subunit 5
LKKGVAPANKDKTILVPLTSSLYVPGKLADTEKVLVDVGAGFYVEKSIVEAKSFYEGKIELVGKSLTEIEEVVRGKSENLRLVEDGKSQLLSWSYFCSWTWHILWMFANDTCSHEAENPSWRRQCCGWRRR